MRGESNVERYLRRRAGKPVKLNVGCGADYREDYFNIDIDAVHVTNADLNADIARLDTLVPPYQLPGPVAEILVKHCLEHVPHKQVPEVLWTLRRVLMPGGLLIIDGPDLMAMARHVAMKPRLTEQDVEMIYGAQRTLGDFHKAGWDPAMLADMLSAAGFVDILNMQVDLCFVMKARKPTNQ